MSIDQPLEIAYAPTHLRIVRRHSRLALPALLISVAAVSEWLVLIFARGWVEPFSFFLFCGNLLLSFTGIIVSTMAILRSPGRSWIAFLAAWICGLCALGFPFVAR